MNKITKLAAGTALVLGVSSAANAVVYDISAVLNGSDGDFSYSGLHYAGDAGTGVDGDGDPQTGSALASIPQASGSFGTYDDVTGDFKVLLSFLDGVDIGSVFFSGTLLFDDAGLLAANSTLESVFLEQTSGLFFDSTFGFLAGEVCCSGTNPPNTFDGKIMTLWGANFGFGNDFLNTGSYAGSLTGLDLRIELTPVPVPAAVWLFGAGLLGLVGVARRKS